MIRHTSHKRKFPRKLLRKKITPTKLLLILAVWGICTLFSVLFKTDGETPVALESAVESISVPQAKDKIRICSWNLRNYNVAGRWLDGKWREHPKPESEKTAIVETLKNINADIVLIQEMGDELFLKDLQNILIKSGQPYAYAATTSFDARSRLAIISKIKPEKFFDCSNISFKLKDEEHFSPRGTLGAKFISNGIEWYAYAIHLKSKSGAKKVDEGFYPFRFAELRAIDHRIFSISQNKPIIMGGDFNNEPSSALLRNLKKTKSKMITDGDFFKKNAYTYYWSKMGKYFIYDFFIENDTMAEYTLPPKIFISKDAKKASDHLPIYVDLDIKKRR